MPKSKHRRQQPIPTQQPPVRAPQTATLEVSLGYDPKGKMESRDIAGYKEGWSEYTLEDGSVIRLKTTLLDIKRAVDQYSPEGDPLYIMQFAVVNQVRAPQNLKKQG